MEEDTSEEEENEKEESDDEFDSDHARAVINAMTNDANAESNDAQWEQTWAEWTELSKYPQFDWSYKVCGVWRCTSFKFHRNHNVNIVKIVK